jgi:hypothetical protein
MRTDNLPEAGAHGQLPCRRLRTFLLSAKPSFVTQVGDANARTTTATCEVAAAGVEDVDILGLQDSTMRTWNLLRRPHAHRARARRSTLTLRVAW